MEAQAVIDTGLVKVDGECAGQFASSSARIDLVDGENAALKFYRRTDILDLDVIDDRGAVGVGTANVVAVAEIQDAFEATDLGYGRAVKVCDGDGSVLKLELLNFDPEPPAQRIA